VGKKAFDLHRPAARRSDACAMVVVAVLFRRWPVRRGQLTHARVCDSSSRDRGKAKGGEESEGQDMSCSCSSAGACQCTRSEPSRAQTEDDAQFEQALLNRTREIVTWWRTQNETVQAAHWFSPMVNETMELAGWRRRAVGGAAWGGGVSVTVGGSGGGMYGGGGGFTGVNVRYGGGGGGRWGGRGGCGCIGQLGCGCAGRSRCHRWR